MERYTKRLRNGIASWDYQANCYGEDEVTNKVFKSAHRQNACEKLAAIEDILGDEYDLDRLRELAEADREGRCVVLPRLKPGQGDPAGEPGELEPAGVETAYREFAEDVIRQFGYHGSVNGRPAYTAGGLSTLEEAFRIVGWDDPRPAPECECEEDGCHEWATSGRPTPNGYKWLCSRHFVAYGARKEAEAALATDCD